jgi:hypothetical protein
VPPDRHRRRQVVVGTLSGPPFTSWHQSRLQPAPGRRGNLPPPSRSSQAPGHSGGTSRACLPVIASLAPSLSVIAGARSSPASLAPPCRSSQVPGRRRGTARLPDRHRRRQAVVGVSGSPFRSLQESGRRGGTSRALPSGHRRRPQAPARSSVVLGTSRSEAHTRYGLAV